MKYWETVCNIFAKGRDWHLYNEQFRFSWQSDPNLFLWDQIHWELWFQTMFTSCNKSHSSSADCEKPPNRFHPQFPKGTWWTFHAGKPCSGCKFEHICFNCGSRHPASQCPSHKGKPETALASEPTHWTDQCLKFIAMNPRWPLRAVKENHGCFSCLKRASWDHVSNCSRRRQCNEIVNRSQCKFFHHPLIHTASTTNSVTTVAISSVANNSETMLPTVLVEILDQ